MSAELRECPFCGPDKGNPQVFPGPGNEGFFIHCITCGISTDAFVDQEGAECAWHMRYAAPPNINAVRQPTPMGWSDTDFIALGNPIPLRIFRKAVMRFKAMAELGVDVESMPMHFMKSPEKYAADVIEANRLLALIDSQRDAAPGVGNG